MEVRAVAKYIKVQPRKVRIVADEVRGQNAVKSAAQLRFHTSKGARALHKVLVSAMANAQENHGIQPEALRIATIMVDEGPRMKRMMARAQGRGNRILKKTSHITVIVEDYDGEPVVTPHGTKAKTRPTFASGKRKGKAAAAAAPVAEAAKEAEVEETKAEEVVEEVTAAEEATPAAEAAPQADTASEGTAAPAETSEEAPKEEGK